MAKNKGKGKGLPKAAKMAADRTPRLGGDPESYLKQQPVWRFADFDWDGPWGETTCAASISDIRRHIEQHLASFETMAWADILSAAGGRSRGTNSHEISRDKFKKEARERLAARGILADRLMSLRLDAGTRLYGVREGNCLRVVFFDPDHKDQNKCAYEFSA